ncbi:hypothetical protein KUTeg_003029 [Tegillarca granosa]|uniref:2-oxoglutarate dehydrogenase, mitochondrial n=1 Tax=Tegillarca granosa TaxID=220873 RepID=A0ABQ9FQF2_TEGGR|nr:hypothetical protein KUTeg_003029 [Tegillarca granosa]
MFRVKTLWLGLKKPLQASCRSGAFIRRSSSKAGKPGRNYASQAAAEPFLSGSSSVYVEEMYSSWLKDPSSVHKSWDVYFRQASQGVQPGQAFVRPPTLGGPATSTTLPAAATGVVNDKVIEDHLAVQSIIRSYQTRGHNIAALDPLGIADADLDSEVPKELILVNYGLGGYLWHKCVM